VVNERTARYESSKEADSFSLHAFGCNKEAHASPGLAVYLHRKENGIEELIEKDDERLR
jgi:hypothetical protein